MKKRVLSIAACLLCMGILSSCSIKSNDNKLLDPENPITVSVWNYYNGSVKEKFDHLVMEFNETVGMDKGIVVEAQSYGDVNELADAAFDSAKNELGAMPMPDIFAAYPDNVYRIDKITELANLKDYFSEEELGEIKNEFLMEGIFGDEQALKILPIAKSTEILYLNKTYWDAFAAETGAELGSLTTWEGLVQTAGQYYNNTGKAFFGIDANANFMLIAAMQLGEEMYTFHGDKASLNFSEDTAYRIWKNYYIPYINGYYTKSGRFSSDDAKTGLIAAYTGSTAGASYFPVEVAEGDTSVPVDVIALPYPYFEGGKPYAVQQGAGMCISKSDASHEYAASIFLKWFIDMPQNIQFAVSTAYLPVKLKALNTDTILEGMEGEKITNAAVHKSIETSLEMFQTHSLYGNRPFHGSFEVRSILETHLLDRVNNDLEILNHRTGNGEKRLKVIEELSSKEQFRNWYHEFTKEIQEILE